MKLALQGHHASEYPIKIICEFEHPVRFSASFLMMLATYLECKLIQNQMCLLFPSGASGNLMKCKSSGQNLKPGAAKMFLGFKVPCWQCKSYGQNLKPRAMLKTEYITEIIISWNILLKPGAANICSLFPHSNTAKNRIHYINITETGRHVNYILEPRTEYTAKKRIHYLEPRT
jgi:hypothetical protein